MLIVVFNILNAISLTVAIYFARQKKLRTHKKWIGITTFFAISLLVAFVWQKYQTSTNPNESYILLMKTSQAFKLFLYAHILAALVSFMMFPLIIGLRLSNCLARYHKKLGYTMYPIWMFSSISGVIVYFVAH